MSGWGGARRDVVPYTVPVAQNAPLVLIRNATLLAPKARGRCDILVGGTAVLAVAAPGAMTRADFNGHVTVDEVDVDGAWVTPGLVDAHVHVTGGGGEAGFSSRVPPRMLTELTTAGVTSVVGVLGTDGRTRTMRSLIAATYGLREVGLSAWCWTGSYEVPVRTLTGSVRDDVVFVDPVVGVGELAISDHRSSQPTMDELLRVAADVHVAGMIAGKAGVLHLHLGDGARGLSMVREALEGTEIPARVFHPTHVNRNPRLFAEALALADDPATRGMTIDLTAFPADDLGDGLSAADGLAAVLKARGDCARVTVSSDGGGCMPHFDHEGHIVSYGVGQSATLLETLRGCVQDHGLALEAVLPAFTSNVASLLRLKGKGEIVPGADADLLVLNDALAPIHVMANGRWMVRDGVPVTRGPFESSCAG